MSINVKELDNFVSFLENRIALLGGVALVKCHESEKAELYRKITVKLTMLKHMVLYWSGHLTWNEDGTWNIHKKPIKKNYNKVAVMDTSLQTLYKKIANGVIVNKVTDYTDEHGDTYMDELVAKIEKEFRI